MTFSTAEHSHGSPCRQNQHARHGGAQFNTTRSPGRTEVTAEPTSLTVPLASCPSTTGYRGTTVPLTIDRSEWHTPAAAMRTRTSWGPSSRSSMSQTSGSVPGSRTTTAATT